MIAAISLVGSAWAVSNQTIVVSAPRLDNLDLMAVDVAADVTTIDAAAIEKSAATSVPDLLQNEANVLIRSTSGNGMDGQISLRGFGENSHLRTLVLVDGHKMNRPDMGQVGWQSVPVANIEKIEVVRGGQNVLYGDRAVGGVVKITTKRGGGAGLHLGGKIGSFGYISGDAGYGGVFGDVDYYAGITGYESDGFRSNAASRATSVYGSAGWYMNDTDTVTLRTSFTDSYMEYPGPLTYKQMKRDPTQSGTSGDDDSDMQSALATLMWETERDWGAARISSGYNWREIDWQMPSSSGLNEQDGVSLSPRVRWGSEANFLLGGVDSFYDKLDFTRDDPRDDDYVASRSDLDRITVSPYLFAQKSYHSGIVLNGGARYEHARTDNVHDQYDPDQVLPYRRTNRGTVPNPDYKKHPDLDPDASFDGVVEKDGWAAEISTAYDLNRNWTIFAGYDRLYRYPTLDETASYQGFPLSDPLNEDLDPETGNNFEIGTRYTTEHLSCALTTFLTDLDDEIMYREYTDPASGEQVRLNENAGSTRRLGAEIDVAYEQQWYGASTRWTVVDARFTDGEFDDDTVPLVPTFYGSTGFWYEIIPELRMAIDYLYVSEQYQGNDDANKNRKLDAYGLVNLTANITVTDYARVQVAVRNLFDETYASVAYSGGFYPGNGRSFTAGITLEF